MTTAQTIARALDKLADKLSEPLTPVELAQIIIALRTTATELRSIR